MQKVKYRYNPETCRYEPANDAVVSILFAFLSIGLMAFAVLVGLLYLYNALADTNRERALRAENAALATHQSILTEQFLQATQEINAIRAQDSALGRKLFGDLQTAESFNKQRRLISPEWTLEQTAASIETLTLETNRILYDSRIATQTAEGNLDLSGPQSKMHYPTLPPADSIAPEQLFSGFGLRLNPYHKGLYRHQGIDITLPKGTKVRATASGKVVASRTSDLLAGYGNFIEIDHGNGVTTRYAHLEQVLVRVGQTVEKGAVIATSGNSGGSISPHLHYEILMNGKATNPLSFMVEGVSSHAYARMVTAGKKQNQSLD